MIADVNASLVDAETVIKPIVDATNELELLRALQNGGFKDVDSKLIDEYKTAMKDTEETKVTIKTTVEEVQNTIYKVNATAAVDALFETKDTELAEKVDQAQIDAAKALVEKLPEEDQATLMGRVETAQTLLDNAAAYAEAKAAVEALFVDAEVEEKELVLAEGVGQAQIDVAKDMVEELELTQEDPLSVLVGKAEALFDNIAGRLNILDTIKVVNKLRTDKVYVLGYWVEVNVNANESYLVEGKKGIVEDTESIVIQLHKGDTLLGEQTFQNYGNVKESDKYTPEQAIVGGTIDVYGDYDSTSWDNIWYKGLTDIPDTAKAIVVYKDGRVVETEKEITGLDVTPFYVEALNRTETVEDMSAAIVELETVLSNGNDFTNLTKQAKLEVAEAVLGTRNAIEDTKKFSLTDGSAYTAVTTAINDRNTFISGVNGAADIVTMREKLTDEGLFPEFFELSAAEKTEVAELVLDALNELKVDDEDAGFRTLAEIKAAAGL